MKYLFLLLLFLIIITIVTIIILCKRDNFNDNNNISIPKVIYITHKNQVPDYVINNWKKLNPEYKINYYNDDNIRKFLQENYPASYLNYFNNLDSHKGSGPIKADFWRICILYKYGGVYVDSDIEPLVPIKNFLEKDTDFLTCGSNKSKNPNPHIIIAKPNDIILKKCLNIYETLFLKKYKYWKHSIVKVMHKALNNILKNYNNNIEKNYYINKYKVQILLEIFHFFDHSKDYVIYKKNRVLNNRYKNYDRINHKF